MRSLIPLVSDFTLGGGTGLALQLAHRKSFDFDFFNQSGISKKLLEKLAQKIPVENILAGVVSTGIILTFTPS